MLTQDILYECTVQCVRSNTAVLRFIKLADEMFRKCSIRVIFLEHPVLTLTKVKIAKYFARGNS